MALLETYGPGNRVQEEGLKTTPSVIMWTDSSLQAHKATILTVTERFRYVGMTYDAAIGCQTDMIAIYFVDGVMQAGISVTRQSGRMWQCEVSSCVQSITIEDL